MLLPKTSITLLAGLLPVLAFSQSPEASPQKYVEDVKYLAAPELQGRGAGTQGIQRASQYIGDRFKSLKLQPAGENNSYWQTFSVTTGANPGPENKLGSLRLNDDYLPLSFSSNGVANASVVFAGYGITAPEFHHDDYTHLDVKDKIVLILRYEPKEFQKDRSEAEKTYSHHASLVSKAINARNHGAKAVLLANGSDDPNQQDTLIKFGAVAGPEDAGILMAHVKRSIADEWIKKLKSGETFSLDMRVDIRREKASVRNVIGYIPGRSKEYVVIGAHYDHLGLGNESSLAPSQIGTVHPGADDNASGTAGLLELARMCASQRGKLDRGVLFIAFAGEEIGLLGSSHWTNHPTLALDDAVAMINMDMIGRVTGSKLFIGGTGTGSTFDVLLKQVTAGSDFKIDFSEDGYSASDHTSFTAKSIPVLFFFSGLHGDYHKPSDTWEKISGPASAKVVNLVYEVASKLNSAPERPKFVKVQSGPHGGAAPSGGGGGYGPYFGSIPDFAPVEKGVKFSDVRPQSPAAKAGLQAGDILIGFGDKPINNLYDFTYALRGSKVGDVVVVKFLREGKEMTANVTLEARK